MLRLCRMIIGLCWGLGLVTLVLAIVMKFSPSLEDKFVTKSHFVLIFAGCLFLCSLATREMERMTKSE